LRAELVPPPQAQPPLHARFQMIVQFPIRQTKCPDSRSVRFMIGFGHPNSIWSLGGGGGGGGGLIDCYFRAYGFKNNDIFFFFFTRTALATIHLESPMRPLSLITLVSYSFFHFLPTKRECAHSSSNVPQRERTRDRTQVVASEPYRYSFKSTTKRPRTS